MSDLRIFKKDKEKTMKTLYLTLLASALFFTACVQPRNETYCVKNDVWVNCPKGVEAGTIIGVKEKSTSLKKATKSNTKDKK